MARKKKREVVSVSLSHAEGHIDVKRPLSRLPSFADGSLTKLKAVFGLLRLAKSVGEEVEPGVPYEASYEDVRTLLGCRDDEHLAAELNSMPAQVPASRLIEGAKGWIGLIPTCWWKDGVVHWEFAGFFVDELLDESSGYHRMNWEVLVSFQGLYAAKIYLYVCPSVGGSKPCQPRPLSTAALRELLGVPEGAYPPSASGRFHTEIRKACDAVSRAADGFTVSYRRTGRAASALHWFDVAAGPKQARLPLSKMAKKSAEPLREKIEAALGAVPPEHRAKVVADLASRGLDVPTAKSSLQELRAYGGALRGLGIELPG